MAIASLADIAAASKGGEDPDPDVGDQLLAADVLWSDPQNEPGVLVGARDGGVGIRFGPDVTEVCSGHMLCLLRSLRLLCLLDGCVHCAGQGRTINENAKPGQYSAKSSRPPGCGDNHCLCSACCVCECVQAFLRDNGLRLILRGHEGGPAVCSIHNLYSRSLCLCLASCGTVRCCPFFLPVRSTRLETKGPASCVWVSACAGPDARVLRPDMPCMMGGRTVDHDTPSE